VGFLARLFRLGQGAPDPELLELLTYEIHFAADGRVAAAVRPSVPSVPPHEHIRLWASYAARTIFNLGGIQKDGAQVVLHTIQAIAAHGIAPDTDYFTLGSPAHRLRRAASVATPAATFHGVFYAYRHLEESGRMITTLFPPHPPRPYTLHAGTALLHAAIAANRADPGALETIGRVAENLGALYSEQLATRQRNHVADLVHLPASAYQAAIEPSA
jgi:hypothetical protein